MAFLFPQGKHGHVCGTCSPRMLTLGWPNVSAEGERHLFETLQGTGSQTFFSFSPVHK